jgi:hypothetical protein
LQFGGLCALAGAGSNSARAKMAAVAVTTFLIQVLIEVLRLVFVRFWTRCGCVGPFSNLLSECPRSPLLERCGSRRIWASALRAKTADRVNGKSVNAMKEVNFPVALKPARE